MQHMFFISVLSFILAGCAAAPHHAQLYSFGLEVSDTSKLSIMDYRYMAGSKVIFGTAAEIKNRPDNRGMVSFGVYGAMPLGDSAYFKWKNKITGEMREEFAEFKGALPLSMTDKRLIFIVAPAGLNIYVLEKENMAALPCMTLIHEANNTKEPDKIAAARYCAGRVTKIYPVKKKVSE